LQILLISRLEQARKGIQSLEEEFTKNQDGLIALRSRINNELNFSNESIHEEDDDIDSMVKQIESKYNSFIDQVSTET